MMQLVKIKHNSKKRKNTVFAWVILSPIMLYYIVFTLIPIIAVFFLSATNWNGISSDIEWIGFDNFIKIATQPEYYQLLATTILFGFFTVVFTMLFGFFVAKFLIKKIKAVTFFRTIWYIPVVVSIAVISQMINVLINPVNGTINIILDMFGKDTIVWQQSAFWMYFWIILLCVWKGLGSTVLLFMAGLQAIPVELYEASQVDGVNSLQKLWYITLPLLRSMTAFILITSIIGAFGLFEPVLLISKGGPDGATKVLMYQIYDEAFKNFNMGLSSAVSVVVLFIVMILTIISMRLSKIRI